jgi:hypothetical protein
LKRKEQWKKFAMKEYHPEMVVPPSEHAQEHQTNIYPNPELEQHQSFLFHEEPGRK